MGKVGKVGKSVGKAGKVGKSVGKWEIQWEKWEIQWESGKVGNSVGRWENDLNFCLAGHVRPTA